MSNWKQRFGAFQRHSVDHEVGGETLRFYPNSVAMLAEVRDLSVPVSKAFAALFSDKSGDVSSQYRKERDGSYEVETTTTNAVAPEITEMRAQQQEKAIENLFNTLCDPRSRVVIGRLIMDSLRDEFPYKKARPAAEVEEFLNGDGKDYEGVQLPDMVQMISGWMKANAKVFGETGEKLVEALRGRLSPQWATEAPTSGNSSSEPSSQE